MPSLALLLLQTAVVQADDMRWLREAKRAQARFEVVRRANLPFEHSSASGSCDARIGRYCYWYNSQETKPAPEPQRIADARLELLAVLDSAAARIEDGWITGQRIRYLLEGGRTGDALAVARACRSERWRCAALEGLALHVAERYPEADSVFSAALREMSDEQRCEWLDLRRMVAWDLQRELSRASCEERARLGQRLFDLSQPFWAFPGNDLRTEHLARLAMAEVLAQSANAHGMTWSDDSRELLVRYGWAEWYTRRRDELARLYDEPQVTGHDRQPSYHWIPDIPTARGVTRLDATAWRLRDSLARSRYAPRHLKRLTDLPHQLTRFSRGDSMLVAATFEVTDTALARDTLTSWLISRSSTTDAAPVVRASAGRGALLAIIPAEPFIASIEVRGRATRHAARARYSVDPLPCHASWCLSDLLLFTPADSLGDGLRSALPLASADMTFSRRNPLGVLWEIRSASGGPHPAWLGLTLAPLRVSPARRLASRLKLAPSLTPIRMRWQANLASGIEAQHVELRLPELASGRYRIELTVDVAGVPAMRSSRDIEVRR